MKKPNIIYILADDMGYGDVSRYNENCAFQTPFLDQLCDNGIHFTDAHTTSSVCTPSRYGILTGRYNWRSRLKYEVLGGFSEPLIESETKTIGHMLQENGYTTACIGKWHLGMDFSKDDTFEERKGYANCNGINYKNPIKNSPITRGFNYFFGISGSLDMPPYVYIENDCFTEEPTRITKGLPGKASFREGITGEHFHHENVLDELSNKVLDKIDEYQNNPFFIYFPLTGPHAPIMPSKDFIGKSNTNSYGDFVLHCDDIVGRIIKRCKDLNIIDDTLIIFASDNGCAPNANFEELHQYGHYPNYHFRGNKADIYEGGHRVPYIMSWPNMIKKGISTNKLVCLSDFFATIADILNLNLPDEVAVDSFSNLPLLMSKDIPIRESVVHQSCDGSLALRKGTWKLEMCPGCGGWAAVKALEERPGRPDFQLYDMTHDFKETTNLIFEYPEIFNTLKEELIDAVKNGRTRPGTPQKNHGEASWQTASFLSETEHLS